jgi:hypothetical protein
MKANQYGFSSTFNSLFPNMRLPLWKSGYGRERTTDLHPPFISLWETLAQVRFLGSMINPRSLEKSYLLTFTIFPRVPVTTVASSFFPAPLLVRLVPACPSPALPLVVYRGCRAYSQPVTPGFSPSRVRTWPVPSTSSSLSCHLMRETGIVN